ncbi:MAG: transglycosylase domain-containing protein, partial [Chitinispirillia bacterium]
MDQIPRPNSRITFSKQTDKRISQNGRIKGKRVFTLIFIIFFIISLFGGAGIRFLYHMYKTLPSPKELANIQPSLVSRVLAADSSLVHEFSIERRFWMSLERIPKDLQNAVISIEDQRFYKHWGISIKRIIGAIATDLVKGEYAQGASTITQQLAKNTFLTARQSIVRKIREAMTAIQIESYYTKTEILELYLNMVYLGAGVYGVEAASQRYFSKSASELNLNECAVLAGCIQLPERYRPDKKKNQQRTIDRRNTVLRAMKKMKFISKEVLKIAINDTIPCNPQFRVSKKAPYFVEMVRQYMENKYGEEKLYNGGLTIYSTLDPIAQDSTDKAVAYFLDSLQMG